MIHLYLYQRLVNKELSLYSALPLPQQSQQQNAFKIDRISRLAPPPLSSLARSTDFWTIGMGDMRISYFCLSGHISSSATSILIFFTFKSQLLKHESFNYSGYVIIFSQNGPIEDIHYS